MIECVCIYILVIIRKFKLSEHDNVNLDCKIQNKNTANEGTVERTNSA